MGSGSGVRREAVTGSVATTTAARAEGLAVQHDVDVVAARADRVDGAAEPHPLAEGAGDLAGQLAHAPGRHGRGAEDEHPHEQAREVGRRRPVAVHQHPGEERVEHLGAQRAGDAGLVEGVREGRVGSPGHGLRVGEGPGRPAGQTGELARVEVAAAQGAAQQARLADGVGHDPQPVGATDEHARAEGLEIERVDVDPAGDGGVGGVEHLEAAVAAEAVDDVGAHAPPDLVAGLEHEHLAAELDEPARAPQAGQPCPHDDDVSVHGPPPLLRRSLVGVRK